MLSTTEKTLPRRLPEPQGVPSAAILAFVDAADKTLRPSLLGQAGQQQ